MNTLLQNIRDLEESLQALDQIDRTGAAPWHSERTVRTALYALGDLRRQFENSEKKLRSDTGLECSSHSHTQKDTPPRPTDYSIAGYR